MCLISNEAILEAGISPSILAFSKGVPSILENVHKLKESLSSLINGSNCNFVRNAVTRLFIGVCNHLKNAVNGFTAVLIGVGMSNLVGCLFAIKLNLYLHQKVNIRRINIK